MRTQTMNTLTAALLRSLRYVDYVAGGDALRDDPVAIVNDGLRALLAAGVTVDAICEDTQFDRDAVQALVEEQSEWSGSPCPHDPANCWTDDATGEHVDATTNARTPEHPAATKHIYQFVNPFGECTADDPDGETMWVAASDEAAAYAYASERNWKVCGGPIMAADGVDPACIDVDLG